MADRGERKGDRIPIQKCRDVLNRKKSTYSDEDILAIRDFLYELAGIDYEVFIHNENKEANSNEKPNIPCPEEADSPNRKHAA